MSASHVEYCPRCDRDTEHYVSIDIRQEGRGAYSNEPYRESTCNECGRTEDLRMNTQGDRS